MQTRKKNTPYKLGLRAREVQRLSILEGTYPSAQKYRSQSPKFIADRVNAINANL